MDATPIIIKRKKSHGAAHHGGSWKVAYADFVTAMMAFFMVMWIMGLSDATKAQIQGYFKDPIGFEKNQSRSKSVISPKGSPAGKAGQSELRMSQPFKDEHSELQKVKERVDKALKANPAFKKFLAHLEVKITPEGLRIEFLEDKDDFFESGQAVLRPGAVKLIKSMAPMLMAANHRMDIEGHTDSAPCTAPGGNYKLSSDRASAMLETLQEAGVSDQQFNKCTGFADKDLRDVKNPLSAVNRRVTILMPFGTPMTATIPKPKDAVRSLMGANIKPPTTTTPEKPNILSINK